MDCAKRNKGNGPGRTGGLGQGEQENWARGSRDWANEWEQDYWAMVRRRIGPGGEEGLGQHQGEQGLGHGEQALGLGEQGLGLGEPKLGQGEQELGQREQRLGQGEQGLGQGEQGLGQGSRDWAAGSRD